MSKVTMTTLTLFLVVVLVFDSVTCNARPEPGFAHDVDLKAKDAAEVVNCDGIGEDECLMRRSLNAHTDYIYTQDANP